MVDETTYHQKARRIIRRAGRLIEKVFEQNAEQRAVDLRLVLRTLREIADIKELTSTLVNFIGFFKMNYSDRKSVV